MTEYALGYMIRKHSYSLACYLLKQLVILQDVGGNGIALSLGMGVMMKYSKLLISQLPASQVTS